MPRVQCPECDRAVKIAADDEDRVSIRCPSCRHKIRLDEEKPRRKKKSSAMPWIIGGSIGGVVLIAGVIILIVVLGGGGGGGSGDGERMDPELAKVVGDLSSRTAGKV